MLLMMLSYQCNVCVHWIHWILFVSFNFFYLSTFFVSSCLFTLLKQKYQKNTKTLKVSFKDRQKYAIIIIVIVHAIMYISLLFVFSIVSFTSHLIKTEREMKKTQTNIISRTTGRTTNILFSCLSFCAIEITLHKNTVPSPVIKLGRIHKVFGRNLIEKMISNGKW